MFDQIIQESGFTKELLRRGREEGEQEGRLKGEQEGRIASLRELILNDISERFPAILQGARTHLETITDITQLQKIAWAEARADDLASLHTALGLPQP